MAFTAPPTTVAIITAGPDLTGPLWMQIASATGAGVAAWIRSVKLQGTVSGFLGAGTVQGKFTVVPSATPVVAAFVAAGLSGPTGLRMASAVGLGVANALNASATYKGVSTGAVGADASRVVSALAPSLATSLISSLAAQGVTGPVALRYATALSNGISAIVRTGSGVGVSTGGGGPLPGMGASVSTLF